MSLNDHPADVLLNVTSYQARFLADLRKSEVEFLLIGGIAMRAHGIERPTIDLDIFVARSKANVKRLLPLIASRLPDPNPKLNVDWLSLPEKRIAFPDIEHNEIDMLTAIGSLDFKSSFSNRIMVEVNSLQVPVMGLRELIYSKLVSFDANNPTEGKERDLKDIAVLIEIWQQRHDKPYKREPA